MPLNIIRNDITKVTADAIVNTANPNVAVGRGTDYAIYTAAGWDELLAERAKIGRLSPGQAARTPAFRLDAKHIIHTVGPDWRGGDFGERETVADCYRNSLALALEYGCESIAFPLISTGSYGFPKDEALRIAISEISNFLFEHDVDVYLVVYDRESFDLSGKAFSGIISYIEEHEVWPGAGSRGRSRRGFENRRGLESGPMEAPAFGFSMDGDYGADADMGSDYGADADIDTEELEASIMLDACAPIDELEEPTLSIDLPKQCAPLHAPVSGEPPAKKKSITIDDIIGMKEETFQQMLFRIIDRKGLTDPQVYRKANIDRKLFSKIRSNVDYNPSKRTVLALIISLELNMDEATDLLNRAGYSLSPSNYTDLAVRYAISAKDYDIFKINSLLFDLDQKQLGA